MFLAQKYLLFLIKNYFFYKNHKVLTGFTIYLYPALIIIITNF